MSVKQRRKSTSPSRREWAGGGDGSLLNFVIKHSGCDPVEICRAWIGDAPMPLDALMCGAPFAGMDLRIDLVEWHGVVLETVIGFDVGNLVIIDAAADPSIENLSKIRPTLGSYADHEARLDFILAMHGELKAANSLYFQRRGEGSIQEAFAAELLKRNHENLFNGRGVPYRPGLSVEILLAGIQNFLEKIEEDFKRFRSANAWRNWTADRLLDKIDEKRARQYDLHAEVDILKAQKVLKDVERQDKEREAADRDFMEGGSGNVEPGAKEVPAGVEGVLFDPAKVPKEALEALDALEHEADKQLPIDLSKPENVEFVLREKAALDQRLLAKALAKADEAAKDIEEVAKAVVQEPEVISDVVVLQKFDIAKNASQNDNEFLGQFSSFAGKSIMLLSGPNLGEVRPGLVEAYPHAVEIIDKILGDTSWDKPVRFRPTLLVGPPGSGKTSLLNAICRAAWVPSLVYSCASVADGSFGGTASQWATRRASVPLEAVRSNNIANPVVILDEIEKTGQSERNGNLLNTLLPFLEVHSSKEYFEPGLEKSVDLSWVSYLATANSLQGIPAPLKDRFRILEMPEPGPQHIGDLSRRIIGDLLKERQIDPRWMPPLAPDEIHIIKRGWAGGSLRRLRRAVEATLDARETAMRGMVM